MALCRLVFEIIAWHENDDDDDVDDVDEQQQQQQQLQQQIQQQQLLEWWHFMILERLSVLGKARELPTGIKESNLLIEVWGILPCSALLTLIL